MPVACFRRRKNLQISLEVSRVCVTYFHGERCERCRWQMKRAERVAAVGEGRRCLSPRTFAGHRNRTHRWHKKSPDLSVEALVFALPIFTVRSSYRHAVRKCPVDTCRHKKSPDLSVEALVFALPIFTASHPATIVGVHVLNFCVRDGNRWTHMTINTNSCRRL